MKNQQVGKRGKVSSLVFSVRIFISSFIIEVYFIAVKLFVGTGIRPRGNSYDLHV